MQRFTSNAAAQAWLGSVERQKLLEKARPWLVGHDDIHLIENGPQPDSSAVSLIVLDAGCTGEGSGLPRLEPAHQCRQAHYPGFQGFKITPPVPNVQDDWLTVVQFDSQDHLDAWLTSADRKRLLDEGSSIFTESHTRTVRSAFAQWFPLEGAAGAAPVWKMNMLVLLGLYPIVFLFGFFVQTPFLMGTFGMPFWASLFVGNVVGVLLLTYVVPWVSARFAWWLKPVGEETTRQTMTGIAVLIVLYALLLLIFSRFPPAFIVK